MCEYWEPENTWCQVGLVKHDFIIGWLVGPSSTSALLVRRPAKLRQTTKKGKIQEKSLVRHWTIRDNYLFLF